MIPIPLRKVFAAAAFLILCLGAFIHPVSAATLTVTNLNDSGAGSLRQAIINAAATGDVIVFAPGVTGTITLTSGELAFTKSLVISGPGAANLTVSGNNTSRVFSVSSGEITISGLRIADGSVSGNPNALQAGGGILNNSARLTVRNCEIANNRHTGGPASAGFAVTGQGGGIFHIAGGGPTTGGRLLMQNCVVINNRTTGGTGSHAAPGSNNAGGDAAPGQGGGLFIFGSSSNSVTLQNCAFDQNSAIGGVGGDGDGTGARGRGGLGQGGAIYVEQNTLLVAQSCTFFVNDATGGARGEGSNTFTTNPADGQGGALYFNGFGIINGCTLDNNDANGGPGVVTTTLIGGAGLGGALFYNFGAVNVDRTTVTNNTANGGTNCTVAGATCIGLGGGIYARSNSAPLNLTNSTVALNFAVGGSAQGGALVGLARGGGIWTEQAVNATNSTIAFNLAISDGTNEGGGLFVSSGVTTLRNALIAANVVDATANDATGAVAAASSNNLIGAGVGLSGITNGTNGNQIGTAGAAIDAEIHSPFFNGGPNRTCAVDFDSPAVNAGNDANAPARDQRGYSRAGVSDIGSFEFDGAPPMPVALVTAAARKFHGAVFFDINLPLTGSPGIECRTGGANGDHTMVFTFANPLTSVGSVSVSGGAGTVVSGAIGANTSEYVVNLTLVANAQETTVMLSDVTDSLGSNSPSVQSTMAILIGDTSASRNVNTSDIGQTKARSGQAVDASNFRSDVTASGGSINTSDIGLVKSLSGTQLP